MSVEGVGKATIGVVPATRAEDVDSSSQPPGLDRIRGSAPLEPPTLPHDAMDIGHGHEALEAIRPATEELRGVAPGKSETILDGLPRGIQEKLQGKLQGMAADQLEAVRNLLHFPRFSRGNTTEASRLDIRTALASFIAQGGNLADAAVLKSELKALPTDRQGSVATLPGHINRAANTTDGLPDALERAFDERIGRGGDDAGRLEALLSVPMDAETGSHIGDRLSKRTVLTACLAQGMSLEKAELLKTQLEALTSPKLATLAADIVNPDIPPFGALAKALIDPGAEDSKARFQDVKDIILDFPDNPGRALRYEHVDVNVGISRDAVGKLTFGNVSTALVRIGAVDPYPTLDAAQIDTIRHIFQEAVVTKYSRAGLPLDMMGAFVQAKRESELAGLPPPTLTDFMKGWNADGIAAVARYGGGDCIGVGEKIVADLKGAGFAPYLAGKYNSDLTRQRVNDQVVYPEDGAIQTGRMTHADVLIPYTAENGKERVLLLTPGMGNLSPEKWFKDFPATDVQIGARRVEIGGGVDASAMQKAQFGMLANLQMQSNAWDEDTQLFGIDLAGGKLYLNRGATANFREAHGPDSDPDAEAISFDYRAALKDPLEQVTVRVWNEDAGVYDDRTITKFESLALFLMAVKDRFGQPDEFVENTLALLSHEKAYQREVLWPSVQAIHGMNE